MSASLPWLAAVFVGGTYLLLRGAEHLVAGASALALRAGVRPVLVGLTVVAFGTSCPELATSLSAAWRASLGDAGAADLAVGNVIGSNICNVGLILGIGALLRPLRIQSTLLRVEIPFMIGISIVLVLLSWRGTLDRAAGLVLLAVFAAFVARIVIASLADSRRGPVESPVTDGEGRGSGRSAVMGLAMAFGLVLAGSVLLAVGAELLVDSAIKLARALDLTEAFIGLTVVALGTSLPELAAIVVAALRRQADLAVGALVGSNVFNVGLVLGLPAVWVGVPIEPSLVQFDMTYMIAISVALLPLLLVRRLVARREGVILVASYGVYLMLLAFWH